jgi:hypothetical protein
MTATVRLAGENHQPFSVLWRFEQGQLHAERAGGCLDLAHFGHGAGISDIGQDRQPTQIGKNLAQELTPNMVVLGDPLPGRSALDAKLRLRPH